LPLAEKLIAAHDEGVDEAEAILEGLVTERWGSLSVENKDKAQIALAFGKLARVLLRRFDRAYGYVDEHGWVAEFPEIAEAAFPIKESTEVREACTAVLTAHDATRFRKLQYHGPEFVSLLTKLRSSGPADSLEHLLAFHRAVQRSRRGGGAWIRNEQGKLVMQVAGRQLLADLGRIG
jgi:hypothetical protein